MDNLERKWRWNYYLAIILNGVALILFCVFYHPPTYEQLHVNGKSKRKQLLHFDWVGVFLLTTGLVLFLIGLNWGGGVYPWTSGHVLAFLLIGALVIVAFCLWETFGPSSTPLIPMSVFKNGKYDAILACACVGAMVSYSTSIIWPQAISALYTNDVKYAGWLAVCCSLGNIDEVALTELTIWRSA
jgi:MFS family permease